MAAIMVVGFIPNLQFFFFGGKAQRLAAKQ
jgi:hypothetical protein